MGSEKRFVYNPSTVDIGRSKFMMNSFWKGSIFHGDLVPLEITRIMPGDSAKYDLSVFIRTATPPIFPIMDSIKFYVRAFYVPERLVWAKEKQFLGENEEGYGIQSEILAPRSTNNGMSVKSNLATTDSFKHSLGVYLGLIRQGDIGAGSSHSPISLNPLRSYFQVYNDWFRLTNFCDPYLWNHNETGDADRPLVTLGGSYKYASGDVPLVAKNLDRFTSCLPWAQKGSPVLLPLGSEAPVIAGTNHDLKSGTNFTFSIKGTSSTPNPTIDSTDGYHLMLYGEGAGASATNKGWLGVSAQGIEDNPNFNLYDFGIKSTNMVADLSAATAASVNQLRLAFATQRYLEQLARSGSRYREYIKGMFGVSIGDTTAQMAEYLGGMEIELNVDQVLQTTGFAASGSTTLGAPGAVSTSAASDYLFTKSFTEPGYLVIVGYTKHNRTYGQGIDEIYQKHEVLEEYNPKFANIGEQAIKKSNLFFTGDVADDNTRFGFQEAWSEYRYKKDMVVGALCPSNTSSFNFTNLADNFATAPTLNKDFLLEDRTNIARCLAGGSSGPDYFVDIKFKRTFVRPMPLYSIPGLIDHH